MGDKPSHAGESSLVAKEELELPSLRVCSVGPLLVQAWRKQPLAGELDAIHQTCEAMHRRYPEGFASFALVRMLESFGSPDAVVRRKTKESYRTLVEQMSVSAIVIDDASLGARTVRVFMSALLLVARPATPVRVFGSFDEGFDWMLSVEGGVAPELLDQTEVLRSLVREWWAKGPG